MNEEENTATQTDQVDGGAPAPVETEALAPSKPEPTEADKAQAVINRKHWEAKQAQRDSAKLQAKLDEVERKLAEVQQTPEPEVPGVPDQYDDDFEQKIAQRDERLRQQTEWRAQQEQHQRDQQAREQENQQRQANERSQAYADKVTESGLELTRVESSINKVAGYGLPGHTGQALLEDEASPLILAHLADNPDDALPLFDMTPHQASLYIGTTLREKAAVLKPKTSSAPEPADVLTGGGVTQSDDPLLKGAQFL